MPVVVITGATGNIGRKLRAHLEAKGGYELRLIDHEARGDQDITVADLASYDPAWTSLFDGADAVVHLAGLPKNQASWAEIVPPNIDGLFNIYLAAAKAGVKRVVFASSVWAVYGNRFEDWPHDPRLPGNPNNPYGVSKLIGERLGHAFYQSHGIEGVAFRIGACRRTTNRADTAMTRGDWEQSCWVSDADVCQGLELGIIAPYRGHHVLNLQSANENTRWDISLTREVLGYAPVDRHVTDVGNLRRLQSEIARIFRFGLPRQLERWISHQW